MDLCRESRATVNFFSHTGHSIAAASLTGGSPHQCPLS